MQLLKSLNAADDPLMVTTRQAASLLGVRPGALRRWASDRRKDRPQPCGWNGRSNLYQLGDLRRFRESRGRSATPGRGSSMDDRSAALSDAFWQAKRNGLTMKAFTEAVKRETGGGRGSSESALRNYLNGRVGNPRREILVAMARALGMEEERELPRLGQVLHPSYENAFDSNEAVMVRAWLCDWHIDLSQRQKKQLAEAGKRLAEERG